MHSFFFCYIVFPQKENTCIFSSKAAESGVQFHSNCRSTSCTLINVPLVGAYNRKFSFSQPSKLFVVKILVQIASGKLRQGISASHRLIGVAVASANLLTGLKKSTKGVEKAKMHSGAQFSDFRNTQAQWCRISKKKMCM